MTSFTIEPDAFRAALTLAGRVVPAKSPWPILQNVKILTNDNRVTLIASNGDVSFETDIPAEVETEGVIVIKFAVLSTFIKAAKSSAIKVVESDASVRISAGRSRIDLGKEQADDYPNYRPPEGDLVTLDGSRFRASLRFCASATADDETRWNIAGTCFVESDGDVEIWGTDGSAMHRATLVGISQIGGGGTLPFAAAHVLLAACEKADAPSFMICEKGWHIAVGATRIWGKVIDGSFPDVAGMVSRLPAWEALASPNRDDMNSALAIASCGADAGSDKARHILLKAEKGQPVILRGQKAAGGVLHAGRAEMTTEATADFFGGVSARYLTNAITGMEATGLSLSFTRRADGAAILSIRPDQTDATVDMQAVIMGLKVSGMEASDV